MKALNIKADEFAQSDLKLWFDEPAFKWMSGALPVGNGYMGAMIMGGVEREYIQFNEESLWAGGPGESRQYYGGNRKDAYKYLPEIRKLVKVGKTDEAHQLAQREMSGQLLPKSPHTGNNLPGFGAFLPFGDIHVEIEKQGEISEYHRELNLSQGTVNIHYNAGNTRHERQFFASYPSRIMVFRFTNNADGGSDYTVSIKSPHKGYYVQTGQNELNLQGVLENNKMEYEARLAIRQNSGNLTFKNGKAFISDAKSLTLILTAATDYLNEYPLYKGRNYKEFNRKTLDAVAGTSYKQLLAEHQADYKGLFCRARLKLGEDRHADMPTDERLLAYKTSGGNDPYFDALYFQMGRYLLMSSSREGSLPANLQGKWNNNPRPIWASDYHFNINIQMAYWLAEVANLSKVHTSFLDYVKTLCEPGRVTAREFFDSRGWVVNTMNNIFGFTATGWRFPWGYFPGAAAWAVQHHWEHYAFTQDITYLKNEAMPIMREASLFWLDYLTETKEGDLISIPSYSPEHGGISAGAFMDHQIAWDLFNNYAEACKVTGLEDAFCAKIVATRDKIRKPSIGRWGQLQEWMEDRDDPDSKHRHVSHLFALHPGRQILMEKHPKLAEAARISLNARGDGGTGWSKAWKINFWARLQNGNRAHKLLRGLLEPTKYTKVHYSEHGGTYANLLCAHPPFQIDGNTGGSAGIAEMLIQSHAGLVHLLPALPDVWMEGEFNGLRARGGFELDAAWSERRLDRVSVLSLAGQPLELHYGTNVVKLTTQKGGRYQFDGMLKSN